MLPLVLFPGAGSELYRGIGSVVVGGLLVSTVFTLVLVPALFSLFLDTRQGLARMFRALSGSGPQVEPGAGD
jgi:HAE1 family hydrophobic/amphiphilic exporter-1